MMAIVQRDPRFTRIGLGVYALKSHLDNLETVETPKTKQGKEETEHARIQGMLIEIGNIKREVEDTYTNDKKKVFGNKTLGSLTTLQEVPPFTYPQIISDSVRYADVIWFNGRGFPYKVFEVEQSTNFRDALVKFSELQDFRTSFCFVSKSERKGKFEKEIAKVAFEPIRARCEFYTYEQIENDYNVSLSKTYL
jgi:hypothetical protein